ncbi:nudix hydrolase 2-like [Wolffia australiana]
MLARSVLCPRLLCYLSSSCRNLANFCRGRPAVGSSLRVTQIERSVRTAKALKFRSVKQSSQTMSEARLEPSAALPVHFEDCREVGLLPATEDDYGGVIVEVTSAMSPEDFSSSLKASLALWRHQNKRGIWIKLPIQYSNLVHSVVQEGFWYHHAEPSYIMLVYWIPSVEHNTLPANASHRVGVGAFVMNDKREILVVQERTGKFRGSGVWKLPTGVVDQGEDLSAGAVREVKEETGIDAEFLEVLAFRQSHRTFFEKSDLFFVCLLRPITFDINVQESEIEAAQWMAIEEYMAQPMMMKHQLMKYIAAVGLARHDKGYAGFTPIPVASVFSEYESFLYLNGRDLNVG